MIPQLVFLQAAYEVFGGLITLSGRKHEEVVRLLARDGVEVFGYLALAFEIVRRAHNKLTLRIIEFVRTFRIGIQRISIIEN